MDVEPSSKKIGINIIKFRDIADMTQHELAKESGVSYATIVNLERGLEKNYTIGTLGKIADALKITVDDLISDQLTANTVIRSDNEHISSIIDIMQTMTPEQLKIFYDEIKVYHKHRERLRKS